MAGKYWLFGGIAPALFLVLAGCGREAEPALTPAHITIESTPVSGARVFVWGEEQPGGTPLTVAVTEFGSVPILLVHEDFRRARRELEVVPGLEMKLVIPLQPKTGFLLIDSEPPGAEVHIDGELRGHTPLRRIELPVGEHRYTLRSEGYVSITERIEVAADEAYPRHHVLTARAGTLHVLSWPLGGAIWINRDRQDELTPATFTLPEGDYYVDVWLEGHVQQTGHVRLGINADETITLRLPEGDVPRNMVLVPGGPFIMGEDGRAPSEHPRHEVVLAPYYIDKYETTHAEFRTVFPAHRYAAGRGHFPVTGVSWRQAEAYAAAVGKRLPTEAEWERAARGTDGREFPWGNEASPRVCNVLESEYGAPTPVGAHLAGLSPVACADMAGNVLEWTDGWYRAYPENTRMSEDYGQLYRVLRGGSYRRPISDARCARRVFDRPGSAGEDYGFRCAKSCDEPR